MSFRWLPNRNARFASNSRRYSTRSPIIHIPKADVYRFGDSNAASPVFRELDWTVNDGENWAIVGSGSGEKTALFETLLGHLRISPPPPPPGLFPALSSSRISLVSFGNRSRASGGAFYDYSARYGAVRDEDRVTLRQTMFPETIPPVKLAYQSENESASKPTRSVDEMVRFDQIMNQMDLTKLLDLPLIALSNGQTRRARIAKAIMSGFDLLLLDEPLTGLDVQNRPRLLSFLRSVHEGRSPRIIIGLRTQDSVPQWISHVALVRGGRVKTGRKDRVLVSEEKNRSLPVNITETPRQIGEVLVDMKNVNVEYASRKVLDGLNWTIREGERWHLQGSNGSGKTTLLSMLTGDHPQSYTQIPPASELTIFSKRRSKIPTPFLQSRIGLVSPELFDAFPRRSMTVLEAIGTGFDGVFVPKGQAGVGVGHGVSPLSKEDVEWRVQRVQALLERLGPKAWEAAWSEINDGRLSGDRSVPVNRADSSADSGVSAEDKIKDFRNMLFASLSAGEQRMVLLMRAIVGQPPLVFLDEVWSGMDEGMVLAARKYLRSKDAFGTDQAVIVVTHWEDEVPWSEAEGVRRIKIENGKGSVI